jgi:carbonic anhydrase
MERFWNAVWVIVVASLVIGSSLQQAGAEVSAVSARQMLARGNERFSHDRARSPHRNEARRIETAKEGQTPFATVVSCADSRVPVEIVFDRGIGDIFVVRDAGNVCGPIEIGSVEYAVEHVHTRLVVVMGHTHCGAVIAAVQGGHAHGSVETILDKVRPAVAEVRQDHPDLKGDGLVIAATRANVRRSMRDLITGSQIIREALGKRQIQVIGAVYGVETGRVTWLGPHPRERNLLTAASDQNMQLPESGVTHDQH